MLGFVGAADADHHYRAGQSGTRAISHTFSASGVWMGEPLNVSGDLLRPEAMYEASRLIARHVRWLGGLEWDFSRLHTMPIPPEFEALIRVLSAECVDEPDGAPGMEGPRDYSHLSLDRQDVPGGQVYLLDPQPARLRHR